jgi:stage II sporulation protein D (peptidoglycan lytic transglycosylase)
VKVRRLALLLLVAACAQPEPAPVPIPESHDPDMRIGVLINARQLTLGGDELQVDDPAEGPVRTLPAGSAIAVTPHGAMVSLAGNGERIERSVLIVHPTDSSGLVYLNGRSYRGTLEIHRADTGIVVINVVSLERYLAGVVGAEMGLRTPDEIEALKAQAIVSRTYALRNQGRWKDRGFDLLGTVGDQVYAGQGNETPLARTAVAATRGEILTWNSEPIDAFFSSTCGGRTEDGSAAFAGAARPYLRSVDDLDSSGTPWCAASPRMRWKAGWSTRELSATLRRTLAAEKIAGAPIGDLRDLRITGRDVSGRVATVELTGKTGHAVVTGQAIRRVLSPPDGGLLLSTDFTVRLSRNGGRIERVDIDGHGSGHAVGMCQWGAIGRARAGQDVHTILASYFPGTEIQRLY